MQRNQRKPAPEPLRFAVASMLSPKATFESYEALLKQLAVELRRPYRLIQRRTYQEVNDLLLSGELDLAFVCSGAVASLPDDAAIDLLAIPVVEGRTTYHSLIIVRANTHYRGFEELRGGRFAYTDPLSNSGYYFPKSRVVEIFGRSDGFFSNTIFTGSHDNSILAVYRHIVDAAAVDSLVFERTISGDKAMKGKLRVIERSPPFPIPPVVAPLSVPEELRARMRRALLDLRPDNPILKSLGFDGFKAGRLEDYKALRKMIESTE